MGAIGDGLTLIRKLIQNPIPPNIPNSPQSNETRYPPHSVHINTILPTPNPPLINEILSNPIHKQATPLPKPIGKLPQTIPHHNKNIHAHRPRYDKIRLLCGKMSEIYLIFVENL